MSYRGKLCLQYTIHTLKLPLWKQIQVQYLGTKYKNNEETRTAILFLPCTHVIYHPNFHRN